jgi:hypothetical protein
LPRERCNCGGRGERTFAEWKCEDVQNEKGCSRVVKMKKLETEIKEIE